MEKSLAYHGSEDMIRNSFHNFIKLQLVGIMKANKALRQFMVDCTEYQNKNQHPKK